MKEKCFYTTEQEKASIISTKNAEGKILIEDAITFDGKYLVFTERPVVPEPTLIELQKQQLAQAEAIANIFELLIGGEA